MRGFSLVEVLVSVLITLVVINMLAALVNPAQAIFAIQAELPDMHQRLRVAADALARDLATGGGGPFPSIAPYRRGILAPDAPDSFRADRLSLLYIPALAARAALSRATDGSETTLVNARPGCPPGEPLCGFRPDTLAVVFDDRGAYETVRISAVVADPPALVHAGFPLAGLYPAGATVAQVEAATYWLQTDARARTSQLMKYDGNQTDLPVADNVSALKFEYYADPRTPIPPGAFTDGPWLPDATSTNRFDADLLRVRIVRATVRVRATQMLLHAPVADKTIHLEIAARSERPRP